MGQLTLAQRIGIAVFTIVVLGIFLSGTLVHLLTESWWFEAVQFADVFWTRLTWQVAVGAIAFLLYGGFLWGNYAIAARVTKYHTYRWLNEMNLHAYTRYVPTIMLTFITVLALGGATTGHGMWETVLKFLNRTPFELADPIYQRDVGFYLFQLPFYEQIHGWLLGLLTWSLIVSLVIYGIKGAIEPDRGWQYALRGGSKTHLSLLLGAIALLFAAGFWLQRYELLYSSQGVVFGAGYTDVHAQEQAYWFMTMATVVMAGLFVASLWRMSLVVPVVGLGLYVVAWIGMTQLYPQFQQRFIVEPNELTKETPYIAHNLDLTRQAYGLADVTRKRYPAETNLNRAALAQNESTVRNIRLWDYRPLLSTYRQLQEIRLYYSFKDVDIDRYTLDGDYRQVMLAARELDFNKVPAAAQNWVNQRLKYTHGYGLTMSPVNVVTPQGLPELFIKDIPPVSSVDLNITEPRIYYGETTESYIFTGTTTEEFDYPRSGEDDIDGSGIEGDEPEGSEIEGNGIDENSGQNATTMYEGLGGVPMPSFWHRLAYAYDFNSLKILISNYFAPTSRIHYYREIRDRINHVAPFLGLDSDPYITVINGRLQWIMDAYTVSNRFPYAEPFGGINYIRNSIKVLVDAYDGTMQFFVVDDADPVLATYQKIYPNLFTSTTQIPAEVRKQFRYPLDLFKIQAQIYLAYHMTDPEVFYNREDLWDIPTEQFDGQPQVMEPYHVIMQLPEEEGEEFILILPFTPENKNNMIAWMAARSDGDKYGEMLLYEFPKRELVYGPSQIEARVDQNPNISPQLTLWDQEGSKVIRGDLLVIPIEQSLLYVEPIYLRAETGELPELKRVIVAYGDQVVMEETLEEALVTIFGNRQVAVDVGEAGEVGEAEGAGEAGETERSPLLTDTANASTNGTPTEFTKLAKSLSDVYEQAQDALQQGDWDTYGQKQQELEILINQFNQQVGN